MNKIKYLIYTLTVMFVIASCEVTDMDVEDNPNFLTPDAADVDLFLTSMQFDFAQLHESSQDFGSQVTRLQHMFGPLYQNAYSPQTFDAMYEDAYAEVLIDAVTAIPLAEEVSLFEHAAIARIIQAMVLTNMVDYFGDVPASQALAGADEFNPPADDGAAVYAFAITLLDQAITLIQDDASLAGIGSADLYYGGNMSNWEALANSLKFRLLLQTRLVDGSVGPELTAILAENIIDTPDESFEFEWGTNISDPASRHPEYGTNYDNGAADYMSNYFMNLLLNDYGLEDPRTRFYFYRQTLSNTSDVNEQACVTFATPSHYGPDDVFCQVGGGYWGRDHGDDSGIPPDDLLRTIWGVYPVGGKFDANNDERGRIGEGGAGAGISPIFTAASMFFLRAEAAEVGLTGEDPASLLMQGVQSSLNKVTGFPEEIAYTLAPSDTTFSGPAIREIPTYVAEVMNQYSTAADGLSIISREFYKASFGNGYDAYNLYRRTGYPDDVQPTFQPTPGAFIRSFFYPANLANLNRNVNQKADQTVLVFWDDGSQNID